MRMFMLMAMVAAVAAGRSADEMLAQAEDEELNRVQLSSAFRVSTSDEDAIAWAAGMLEIRLGEDGVEDEILPTIPVGATQATMMDAPDAKGVSVLGRKQLGQGLKVDVLESQLVIISNMESKDDRARREAAGITSTENVFASELACRPINGTALFMLVHRNPVAGSPHVHELAFFDRKLWDDFLLYMETARKTADFFGGSAAWAMRIHWQVLPHEQRAPFVLRGATQHVAATPRIRQPM